MTNISSTSYDFGGMNAFYSIGYGMSMGLVPTLSDELLKEVADLVTSKGDKSTVEVANDIAKAYSGPIVFMVFGGLLALFALVSCISIFFARCVCGCCGATKYQPANEHRWSLFTSVGIVCVAVAFILTGCILYGVSVSDAFDAVKNKVFEEITQLIADSDTLLTQTTLEFMSSIDSHVNATFSSVQVIVAGAGSTIVSGFMTKYQFAQIEALNKQRADQVSQVFSNADASMDALTNIQNPIAEVNTTIGDVATVNISTVALQEAFVIIDSICDNATAQAKGIKQDLDAQMQSVATQISSTQNSVLDTISSLVNSVQDFHNSLRGVQDSMKSFSQDIKDYKGLDGVHAGIVILGILPLAIALIFLVVLLTGGIARIIRKDEPPFSRSSASHFASLCGVVGIYVLLFIAFATMLVTVGVFFGGFMVSSVCKPLFRDSSYALFHASDDFNINVQTINSSNTITRNIGSVLDTCKRDTLYIVFGGRDLMSTQSIMSMVDFDKYEQESKSQVPDDVFHGITFDINVIMKAMSAYTANTASIADATGFLANSGDSQEVREARVALKTLQDSLLVLRATLDNYKESLTILHDNLAQDQKATATLLSEIDDEFNVLRNMTKAGINDLINDLSSTVAPCAPFLTLYDNVGVLICDNIGRPVYGIWEALGMSSLILVLAAFAFLFLTRWLRRMDPQFYAGAFGRQSFSSESNEYFDVRNNARSPAGADSPMFSRRGHEVHPTYPVIPQQMYPDLSLPKAKPFEDYRSNQSNYSDPSISFKTGGLQRY